jgi:hypothetical protein
VNAHIKKLKMMAGLFHNRGCLNAHIRKFMIKMMATEPVRIGTFLSETLGFVEVLVPKYYIRRRISNC